MTTRVRQFFRAVLCMISSFSVAQARPALADSQWERELGLMLKNGGCYAETADGNVLFAHRADERFIPASTFKVATAAFAVEALGRDFKFKTPFYLDQNKNLFIKGQGDPFLVSEEFPRIARALAKKTREIRDIVTDSSYFSPLIKIDGSSSTLNPYDAPPAALAANFNSMFIEKNNRGDVSSAESQTPLVPLAKERARTLPAGQHRIALLGSPAMSGRYVGEILQAFLEREGVRVKGEIRTGDVPPRAELVYEHESSRPLSEVVQNALEFSSNFTINELFLALGAKRFSPPATLEKAQKALSEFLVDRVGLKDFHVEEASGLSRKNEITPREMVRLLKFFQPNQNLLPVEKGIFHAKTGTLTGVNTYSGYFTTCDGIPVRFSILVNSEVPFQHKFKVAEYLRNGLSDKSGSPGCRR